MADFDTTHYQAIASQIRRCLNAMTDDQINRGLTAFEDGASSWSQCFWARVFKDVNLYDVMGGYKTKAGLYRTGSWAVEWYITDRLGLPTPVPMRIVYNLFDNAGPKGMKRQDLAEFIRKARLEGDHDSVVLDLLRSLPNLNVETCWDAEVCGHG